MNPPNKPNARRQRLGAKTQSARELLTVVNPSAKAGAIGVNCVKPDNSERRLVLLAYAFQSPWAAKHLTADPHTNSPIERQRKYMFGIIAEEIAPQLNWHEHVEGADVHRIWETAAILHESGPLPITKREAEFMRGAVLDMEARAKIYRASYPQRAARATEARARRRRAAND